LVTGPAGEVLAFTGRRLTVVLVFTMRDNLIHKIEATVDPSAARG
jgi:RNA polymerase sigma-70 factor (ECF subfamily)